MTNTRTLVERLRQEHAEWQMVADKPDVLYPEYLTLFGETADEIERQQRVAEHWRGQFTNACANMEDAMREARYLRADAARYRWLREHGFSVNDPNDQDAEWAEWTFEANEGAQVEMQIDAWMAGKGPESECEPTTADSASPAEPEKQK